MSLGYYFVLNYFSDLAGTRQILKRHVLMKKSLEGAGIKTSTSRFRPSSPNN